mgnify:CR=1 FL=1
MALFAKTYFNDFAFGNRKRLQQNVVLTQGERRGLHALRFGLNGARTHWLFASNNVFTPSQTSLNASSIEMNVNKMLRSK